MEERADNDWEIAQADIRRALLACFPDRADRILRTLEQALCICPECCGKGWDVYNDGTEIQRCDSCAALPDDNVARRRAITMARRTLRAARGIASAEQD